MTGNLRKPILLLTAGLDNLTFATYNMHRFKQDRVHLQDLCKQFHIVFVQEHWLAPFNLLDIQDLSSDSIRILTSATNDVTAAGVLKGGVVQAYIKCLFKLALVNYCWGKLWLSYC